MSRNQGFSIIELIICMALFGMLGSASFVITITGLKNIIFHSDRAMLQNVLTTARMDALLSASEPQGVRIADKSITLFSGQSFSSMPSLHRTFVTSMHLSGNPVADVLFQPYHGSIAHSTVLPISDDHNHRTITINSAGAIE